MSRRTIGLDDDLHGYLLEVSLRDTPLLARLRAETADLGDSARMQISPEQGQFMALLVRLTGARRIVEVGTFTGYSALCMASALPPDGQLVACDISDTWTAIARRYWAEAGVADRIDLRLGPGLETLESLQADGLAGQIDLAFIDADKSNYLAYYEALLALLRPGGLMMVDNVLWSGSVLNADTVDPDTRAIQALNRFVHDDQRVDVSLLPIGDGLSLIRRR